MNEILQWLAIVGIASLLLYPPVKQFLQDFNSDVEDYE